MIEVGRSDIDCTSLPSRGPCMAAAPRWFFDAGKGQCAQFTYGGCGGNENNYVTLHECAAACEEGGRRSEELLVKEGDEREAVEEADACLLDPSAGPCNEDLPRYCQTPNEEVM